MSLEPLVEIVMHHGVTEPWPDVNQKAFDAMFGSPDGRYEERAKASIKLRAPKIDEEGVPFVAYIDPSNPDSGQYGGMSIAIFPIRGRPSLLTFVVGTYGIEPDSSVLGRAGHARKVRAICAWLNRKHGGGKPIAWAKQDPVRTDLALPDEVQSEFEPYGAVFKRYGKELYATFASPDAAANHDAVTAFFDLMLAERGHRPLTKHRKHEEAIRGEWMSYLLPDLLPEDVLQLLHSRRFVIVQGPPGTGKTRMAENLIAKEYSGRGKTIQFHPNTTYESFVGGLAPVTASASGLGFAFAPLAGALMEAAAEAARAPSLRYLLHVDEINRADLSKVLGEAIYLFEAKPDRQREVQLPYEFPSFGRNFKLPENLDVIGTMNTADRSLAVVDVAVRRRFAFADLWPQSSVVVEHGGGLMAEAFTRLQLIFIEHATDEAFNLMPGHAYFLQKDDKVAAKELNVTLAPLLREYLSQGYVSGFAEPIRSYLQWLDSL